jgi:DNA/RNA endonuclease YhcR with UshA esterase domain
LFCVRSIHQEEIDTMPTVHTFSLRRAALRAAVLLAAVAGIAACATEIAPPFELEGSGSLQGRLFFDADNSGVFNPLQGDTALANVGVAVRERGTPRVIASATTDAEGRFRFENLPLGTHDVFINEATLPALRACANPYPVSVFRGESRFLGVGARRACLVRIQDAKALQAGTVINIRGTVTVQPGQHRSQGDDMYIQDASGAIKVFGAAISGWGARVGDLVDVTGSLLVFSSGGVANELQVGNPQLALNERIADFGAVAPRVVTTQYASTQGGLQAPDAGRLIRLERARLTGPFELGGGRNARFDDGTGPVEVRLDTGIFATTAPINAAFTVGQCYNVTGSLTPFAGAAQVKPRSMADFQEVPCN